MAGIFGDETIRLLREIWATPTMLAEELFAIFTGTKPIEIPAGSSIAPPTTPIEPYLTLPNYTPGQPIFNLTRHGLPVGSIIQNPNGTLGLPGSGGGGGGGGGGGTSNAFPGQVVSGSGSTYLCTVYPKGLGGGGVNVTVFQLQIDPGATIPAGTWAMVSLTSDGLYSMQVAVWL